MARTGTSAVPKGDECPGLLQHQAVDYPARLPPEASVVRSQYLQGEAMGAGVLGPQRVGPRCPGRDNFGKGRQLLPQAVKDPRKAGVVAKFAGMENSKYHGE